MKKNRNGFLGHKLSERDENRGKTKKSHSEFLCPKCFWVLFAEKVPNESSNGNGFYLALASLLDMPLDISPGWRREI